MRKTILILGREISILTRSKIFPLLIVVILLSLCGLFPEAKRYAEHAIKPDLVLEYQRAIITGAIFISVILPVGVGRIMISIIGASLLAKEFEANTMSTLGTLPIKRKSILLGKFLTLVLISFIVALFYGLGAWVICFLTLGLPSFGIIVLAISFIFLACLIFASISIFVSSLFKNSVMAISTALGLIYLSGFLIGFPTKPVGYEKFIPEYYLWTLYDHLFNPELIGQSDPSFYASVTVPLLAIIGFLMFSAVCFRLKDI